MQIRPIKTDADYQKALKEIEKLFDATPGSAEADRLEVLTTLVEAYEEQNYPIPLPDPVEAIKYHIESRGLSPEDLEPIIGSRRSVNDLLNRKIPLTIEMIRKLHSELGISADVLIQPYATVKSAA
ncbi:MAG TPA: helix-turn-helix domain-containing protein [bacterium]